MPTGDLRPPRLVATDLDGTLLGPDGTVSPRTVAALAAVQRAGIEVIFVTARPHRWLTPIRGLVGGHGTAICANGASVIDVATLTVVEEHGMAPDTVRQLAARLRAQLGPAAQFATESAEGFAAEHRFTSGHPVPVDFPAADRIESVLTASTLKLMVRTGEPWTTRDPDRFNALVAEAAGQLATASSSGANGLGEIAAFGVTKARTLARWAAARQIDAHEVWAVGDAPNDLPMLRWAGQAFAVANAHHQVLAAVAEVIPSHTDDGVARLLERVAAGSSDALTG